MEPAQTKWTGSIAVAHQRFMEHNVKQVTLADYIRHRLIIELQWWSSINT